MVRRARRRSNGFIVLESASQRVRESRSQIVRESESRKDDIFYWSTTVGLPKPIGVVGRIEFHVCKQFGYFIAQGV